MDEMAIEGQCTADLLNTVVSWLRSANALQKQTAGSSPSKNKRTTGQGSLANGLPHGSPAAVVDAPDVRDQQQPLNSTTERA